MFKAFGFANLPAGTTFTAGINPLPTRFTTGAANEIQGIGFDALPPAPQNGLKAGEGPFTFSITFGGTFYGCQHPGHHVRDSRISGPNGCSTKLEVSGTGVVNDNGAFPNPACGTTVIPEPITMTLLNRPGRHGWRRGASAASEGLSWASRAVHSKAKRLKRGAFFSESHDSRPAEPFSRSCRARARECRSTWPPT